MSVIVSAMTALFHLSTAAELLELLAHLHPHPPDTHALPQSSYLQAFVQTTLDILSLALWLDSTSPRSVPIMLHGN